MIEYSGLSSLPLGDQIKIKTILDRVESKLDKKRDIKIRVEIKTHETQSKRKQYSLHARISEPRLKLSIANAIDWDLTRAVHRLVYNLENALSKKEKSKPNYRKARN